MCTISYLPNTPSDKGFLVTDNRDESVARPADFPAIHSDYAAPLYYPKDRRAGGTWIGLSPRKKLIALMNGAFSGHKRNPPYRKSRGIVVKELLAAEAVFDTIKSYDFSGIEQFFSLLFDWESGISVYELVWDGVEVYLNKMDESKPHIWSSMMSYSMAQHQRRERKFSAFIEAYKPVTPECIWEFHHDRGDGPEEGILIDRGSFRTTSISQFRHLPGKQDLFKYEEIGSGLVREEAVLWGKKA